MLKSAEEIDLAALDESLEGLAQLHKNRIMWGLRFWMGYENVKVEVGPTADLTGIDYLFSSR